VIYFSILPNRDNPEGKTDETKLEYLNVLFEEFLQLLIILIGERYDTCIANVNKEAKLKREVIHQLCISPMAHSDILKNIYPDTVIFIPLFTFQIIFSILFLGN
jgi:GTPase SAR1 family protein